MNRKIYPYDFKLTKKNVSVHATPLSAGGQLVLTKNIDAEHSNFIYITGLSLQDLYHMGLKSEMKKHTVWKIFLGSFHTV